MNIASTVTAPRAVLGLYTASMRVPLLVAIIVAIMPFSAFALAMPVQTCPPGQTLITTEAEREQATNAGIPESSKCWNPDDANTGKTVAQAKTVLNAMRCNTGVNIEQLDPKFSACAARFFNALREKSPSACIESAYRDAAKQAATCRSICGQLSCPGLCAAPGTSYHQKGLAIDIGKLSISGNQLWQLASQFGLGNPNGLHRSDPNHIQVMNGGSNCSDIGYQPTTDDAFIAGPPQSNPYFNYRPAPMTSAPAQSFTAPIAAPLSSPATTPTQPTSQICTPTFTCTNGVMNYLTSSCTTQTYQVCAYGCSGNTCAPAPSSSNTNSVNSAFGTSSTSTITTTNTNTNENTNTTSIADYLSAITNPFSAAEIGTSTGLSFELNPDTGEISDLSARARALVPTSSIGVIKSVQPTLGQQTFTSSDLVNTPSSISRQATGFQQILDGLRQALTWAVQFLKPFGGAQPTP